jgi:hypothetical protein
MTAADETTFSGHPYTQNWTNYFWEQEIRIYNISEEFTPFHLQGMCPIKGPPPPTGLPCPYISLFTTFHLFFFKQNG